ncbi:NAD(P)-binding protein [Nocardia sp. SYP-A9097]|uniref:flavin monoamine oxidase family protein n=1 Tax=Nocardia sp. SYP-A9097 TaxID=2663237 RepID=UPI00132BBE10|nr:FAD-dependent oxidoreductase [Nocardia sp. SYP-A9097]MRH92970.1 NAD(P)-binding protein [Nocardia sp. SYP-A9097]
MNVSRRTILKAGAVAAAAGALRPATAFAGSDRDADVIVVGAGLSGLAATKALRAAGQRVLLLEARERAGGRVFNATTDGGLAVDGGAEFLGPTQDRIAALAAEYGVPTLPTYNQGESLFSIQGALQRVPAGLPLPILPGTVETMAAMARIDLNSIGFPVGEPWRHPDAARLDAMTWQDWIDANASTDEGKLFLALAESATLSVRPHELSALFMMNYFASAGNAQNPGSFERLLGVDGGAQERFFDGGAALVPLRMAESLCDSIVYGAAVRAIDGTGSNLEVFTDRGSFRAAKVVVAMSPAISGRIDFRPGLPSERVELARGYTMGRIAKFLAVYDQPFWRENGLTGQVVGDGTPIDVTYESYGQGHHILMGFISADAMADLDNRPDRDLVESGLDCFVQYFGPEARTRVIDYGFKKWDNDPYSWGGPTATTKPGILTRFGPALREPVGGIHWAGTETADYWQGYMDGAIRSGERAAAEILAS